MKREEAIDIIKKYDINGCGYCHQGGDEVEEAFNMAIQALEHTLWIPVSERMPKPQEYGDEDYSDWVQITLHIGENNDVVGRGYYCFNERKWYADRLGVGVVTAWMPLPEPYKVESEE